MATLRRRILFSLLAVLGLLIAALAYTLSHETACQPAPALAPGTPSMKAVLRRCYGSPDVLAIEDVEKPVPKAGELLIKVRAASAESSRLALDARVALLHAARLRPRLAENPRVGVDFAGTVEAVGKNVTLFKPGDAVFGGVTGAVAEYLVVSERRAVGTQASQREFRSSGLRGSSGSHGTAGPA